MLCCPSSKFPCPRLPPPTKPWLRHCLSAPPPNILPLWFRPLHPYSEPPNQEFLGPPLVLRLLHLFFLFQNTNSADFPCCDGPSIAPSIITTPPPPVSVSLPKSWGRKYSAPPPQIISGERRLPRFLRLCSCLPLFSSLLLSAVNLKLLLLLALEKCTKHRDWSI